MIDSSIALVPVGPMQGPSIVRMLTSVERGEAGLVSRREKPI